MRPSHSRHLTLAGFLVVLGAAPRAGAQAAPQSPPSCDAPEYRQFDFWVGDWTVVVAGKGTVGTNLVTLEEKGCLIHEHWHDAKGGTGQSFNFFDRTDRHWHQVWVSSTGNVLRLTGDYHDGQLAMTGERTGAGGVRIQDRLTFFNNADGTVRQLWEMSRDGGQTWQTAFDGLYQKRAP